MPHILLTGAGFSRNRGGWLADEAFEYLLGCPQLENKLRKLLWDYKGKGGFEAALTEQQAKPVQQLGQQTPLEEANQGMFTAMNEGFATIEDSVRSFLSRFDAIFTLNQDLLMERHYLTEKFPFYSDGRWNGWQIPGMEPTGRVALNEIQEWSPMNPSDQAKFVLDNNSQPYFKLHGSSNWIDRRSSTPMLVIGGNKPQAIERHPILKWNYRQFGSYLAKPDTRLMVIGYSFGDHHINRVIGTAAGRGTLQLFIIDPAGVDVLDNSPPAAKKFPGDAFKPMKSQSIGASRRPLRNTLSGRRGIEDLVEYGKVMRFFGP